MRSDIKRALSTVALLLALLPAQIVSAEDTSAAMNPADLNYDQSPLYVWRNQSRKPKACVIAAHGMTLHGGTFESVAKYLVDQGYDVYCPDMVGFGKWDQQIRGSFGQTIL